MQRREAEEYILRYRDMVFRIAFQYFKNPHDADDITQIVCLKLLGAKKEFDGEDHVRHWLVRVTINECKRLVRAPFFTRQVPLEEYMQDIQMEEPEEQTLFAEVMRLPEKYRIVVHLFYYEDFSVREISEWLNISESAVTTRLSRARERIREHLEADGRECEEL